MSLFNCLYVIPGPGSLYRKKVILEVGGFSTRTLTEDMEIAFKIQCAGYIIENSLNASVKTETPQKFYGLLRQRKRWYAGFIEDSLTHKDMYLKKKTFLSRFLLPVNIISIFALIFITFYFLLNFLNDFFNNLINIQLINFDILTMIKFPELSVEIYKFSFMNILTIIFSVLTMVVIYLSLKVSKEKIDLKNNWFNYISYFLLYSFLMTVFWVNGIIYKLFFRNSRVGWKHGS